MKILQRQRLKKFFKLLQLLVIGLNLKKIYANSRRRIQIEIISGHIHDKLLPTPYQFKSYTKVHIIYTTRGYTVTVYVLEDMCEALDYESIIPLKAVTSSD